MKDLPLFKNALLFTVIAAGVLILLVSSQVLLGHDHGEATWGVAGIFLGNVMTLAGTAISMRKDTDDA